MELPGYSESPKDSECERLGKKKTPVFLSFTVKVVQSFANISIYFCITVLNGAGSSWPFLDYIDLLKMKSSGYSKIVKYVFLAHLSRRLKCAFLITICQLSVIVVVVVNFSHFHLLLQNH